jgi:cytochrome P450 family 6
MLYMFAGYETSATAGQFAAYELACNPHIQAKAREEVQRVLAKHDGECTYEAQNEMVYLNMVIDGEANYEDMLLLILQNII